MFMLYAIVVRPLIKTPALADGVYRPMGASVKGAPNEYADLAKKYLPDQAWAADAAYQMGIDNGAVIFFENWERSEENNMVRFKPFAMIWMQAGHDPDEEPICVISDSARVEFVRKFDFPNPQPGRVIGGALEGACAPDGSRQFDAVRPQLPLYRSIDEDLLRRQRQFHVQAKRRQRSRHAARAHSR